MEIVVNDPAWYHEVAKQNHRGLVPMQFLEHAMPYVAGDIAGFPPKDARAMHGAGQAVPYFPDELDRPADRPSQQVSATDPAEIARLSAIEVTPAIFAEGKLAQIGLAKKILNVPQNTGGIDSARAAEVIRAELARRGTPDEGLPAVNSGNGTGPAV